MRIHRILKFVAVPNHWYDIQTLPRHQQLSPMVGSATPEHRGD